MKKLRSNAYRLVLAATILLAVGGALLAVLAAATDEGALLGWAVGLLGWAVAGLAVAIHFRTGRALRALAASRTAAANPAGLVAVDNTILEELRELRKSVKLSLNNEMFLLDEIQGMRADRSDDH